MTAIIFCDRCGNKLDEGSQFCHACGKKIDYAQTITATTATTSGHSKMLFPIVLLVLFLGLGYFVAYGYFSNATTNVQSHSLAMAVQQVGATSSTLSITSVNPEVVLAPYENIIAINGTGFEASATVQADGTPLAINGDIVANLIYAQYPGNFKAGKYDVTVTNSDGQAYTAAGALTIQQSSAGQAQTQNQNQSTELSSAQIVAKIAPSVVLIRTDAGCGSGMVIQSDGTILTDDHVITGAAYIHVYLSSGALYQASVINEDTAQDLALIKITASGLMPITLGDSSDASLSLGTPVTAIGYPLTCNQDQTLEADPGIVTARRSSPQLGADAIQTSARINPGDSGGPLVDNYGDAIGINESILTVENLDLNITGIAFATPSEVITPFINGTPAYSAPVQNGTSYSAPAAAAPSTPPISAPSRYFQMSVAGSCDNDGNGTIILNGYPYVDGYEIPSADIDMWSDGEISFTVPAGVATGTYQVDIRGYEPGTGFCPDVKGDTITVE